MAFKSEIHVAELASIRTGHAEGDIYYILDNGMLGDLPCKPGTFVKWHNDTWQIQPDEHYALASTVDGEIAQAIDNILDDGSASEAIVVVVPSSQSSNYTVGDYYEVQGKVAKLRTKTEGDNVTQLTFDTTSGLLDTINDVVEDSSKIAVFEFSGTDYPLIDDMNDEYLKGKTVVLMHNPGGTQDDLYYLVRRVSGGGHITMQFEGKYNSITVADDTWTFYNDTVNAVAIAPLFSTSGTYDVGDAVMYNGKRYVSNVEQAHAEWASANWTEKSVEDEIGNVEALLAAL